MLNKENSNFGAVDVELEPLTLSTLNMSSLAMDSRGGKAKKPYAQEKNIQVVVRCR